MAADQPAARFATWLLRPYLDLGASHSGPLHAQAVEHGWTAFEDGAAWFHPQRALPPAFRVQLAQEAPPAYDITDPRDLPESLRTKRWQALCEAIDAWNDLPDARRCRLASLLHSMCLYRTVLALVPGGPVTESASLQGHELAWWRASAEYMLGLTTRTAQYHHADLSVFEALALQVQGAGPTAFNASVRVFVHKAKTGASIATLTSWRTHLEKALAAVTPGVDAFTAGLLASRFHRAVAFLPQRRGDREAVVCAMAQAERLARALTPVTPPHAMLYRENLHAVIESRTKEALWLGDLDHALVRAEAVLAVDPHDAKAWVEAGQVRFRRKEWREAARAYAVAATLGPPATAVARHMTAVCLRELGDDALAALLFKDTLEIDALGISPREEIARLPDEAVLEALKHWSRTTVEW